MPKCLRAIKQCSKIKRHYNLGPAKYTSIIASRVIFIASRIHKHFWTKMFNNIIAFNSSIKIASELVTCRTVDNKFKNCLSNESINSF